MANPSPRRAFLFDLDGTLINSSPLHARAFLDVLTAEAAEIASHFDYRTVIGMETGAAFAQLGLRDPAVVSRLSDMKRERYRELAQLGLLEEMPGAGRLLEGLRERGATVGVVTSASAKSAQLALEITGLRRLVDFLVSADDAARSKPHPDPYLRGLERCGTEPVQAIAIEDAPAGAEAARAAGLPVWGVHDRSVTPFVDRYFESLDLLREALVSHPRRVSA